MKETQASLWSSRWMKIGNERAEVCALPDPW